MSDNIGSGASKASSDSVDRKDTAPGPQTLLKLPTELIDTIAEFIDCQSYLFALRATCRTLHDATALQVCKSFFSPMSISGSSKSLRLLTTRLTSPNLPQAQCMARRLIVSAPEVERGPYRLPESFQEPSIEDVARLLAALPNLDYVRFTDGRDTASHIYVVKSARLFLACMAKPPIRETIKLGRLDLQDVRLDGDLLASVLESQKDSLRHALFWRVTVTRKNAWPRILAALRSADGLRFIHLSLLQFVDQRGKDRYLKFPKQALEDFLRRTGAKGIARGWGVRNVDAPWGKAALEIILQSLPGGDAIL